jgi:hypothetical protein
MIGRYRIIESIVSTYIPRASPGIYAGGGLRRTRDVIHNVVFNEDKLLTSKIRGISPRAVTIGMPAPSIVEY